MGVRAKHTLVKKSLQPAANASCRSLCKLLAVNATMMTGLRNSERSGKVSSALTVRWRPGRLSAAEVLDALKRPDAVLGKTPIPFKRSRRRISFVASRPFITGSWISIKTKWNPPCRHFRTASSPFAAHFQRTFNRFMKASKSF